MKSAAVVPSTANVLRVTTSADVLTILGIIPPVAVPIVILKLVRSNVKAPTSVPV